MMFCIHISEWNKVLIDIFFWPCGVTSLEITVKWYTFEKYLPNFRDQVNWYLHSRLWFSEHPLWMSGFPVLLGTTKLEKGNLWRGSQAKRARMPYVKSPVPRRYRKWISPAHWLQSLVGMANKKIGKI